MIHREELIDSILPLIPGRDFRPEETRRRWAGEIVDRLLAKLSEDDPERVERAAKVLWSRGASELSLIAVKEALDAAGPTVVVKELAIDREKAIEKLFQMPLPALKLSGKEIEVGLTQEAADAIVDAVIECVEPVERDSDDGDPGDLTRMIDQAQEWRHERDEWKETARSAQDVVDEWKARARKAEAELADLKCHMHPANHQEWDVMKQRERDAVLVIQKLREALGMVQVPIGAIRATFEALGQADEFLSGATDRDRHAHQVENEQDSGDDPHDRAERRGSRT